MYTSCKIWKNPLKYQFLWVFFHSIGPTLAQTLPQRPHPRYFLADFQWNMLGDTININNLCCNPAVLEKCWLKPLKNCCFWTQFVHSEKGSLPATSKVKKIFFGRNNKSKLSAFRRFLFYQNICLDWVMNLFLSWVVFSVKKSVISSGNSCDWPYYHYCWRKL